jgi:hypothetical protein
MVLKTRKIKGKREDRRQKKKDKSTKTGNFGRKADTPGSVFI